MHFSSNLLAALLIVAGFLATSVRAGDAESAIPEPDIFVEQAAQTSLVEIEASRLALARSQDPGIRTFAQRMIRDHGKTHAELVKLAGANGLSAPTQLDAEHQAALDDISASRAEEFDRHYAEHMNMGHTRALALFEAATNSPDAAIAGFAKKTLPTLREHKALAGKLPGSPKAGELPGGL